jgi:hypothetical protein
VAGPERTDAGRRSLEAMRSNGVADAMASCAGERVHSGTTPTPTRSVVVTAAFAKDAGCPPSDRGPTRVPSYQERGRASCLLALAEFID